jgi:hypothetical protein
MQEYTLVFCCVGSMASSSSLVSKAEIVGISWHCCKQFVKSRVFFVQRWAWFGEWGHPWRLEYNFVMVYYGVPERLAKFTTLLTHFWFSWQLSSCKMAVRSTYARVCVCVCVLHTSHRHVAIGLQVRGYCMGFNCTLDWWWPTKSVQVGVILRPTLSRPVCLGVRHPSRTRNNIFSFLL